MPTVRQISTSRCQGPVAFRPGVHTHGWLLSLRYVGMAGRHSMDSPSRSRAGSLQVCPLMPTTLYRNLETMGPIPARPTPSTTCHRTHTLPVWNRRFRVLIIVTDSRQMPFTIFHSHEDQRAGCTTPSEIGGGAQFLQIQTGPRAP